MHRTIRHLARAALLVAPALTLAQPPSGLPTPRSVERAYAKGTRSRDGRPGPKYWQNRARYAITVTAAPPARTVRGTEQITYLNASPDTLRALAIKLFMNVHKPGAPRLGAAAADYLTSGVTVD